MQMEIGQSRTLKCLPKDFADRLGAAPVRSFQSRRFKLVRLPYHDARCRKQWIVITPQLLFPQKPHPFRHNLLNATTHREK